MARQRLSKGNKSQSNSPATATADTVELLHDIHRAERQLSEGLGVSHEEAKVQILTAISSDPS